MDHSVPSNSSNKKRKRAAWGSGLRHQPLVPASFPPPSPIAHTHPTAPFIPPPHPTTTPFPTPIHTPLHSHSHPPSLSTTQPDSDEEVLFSPLTSHTRTPQSTPSTSSTQPPLIIQCRNCWWCRVLVRWRWRSTTLGPTPRFHPTSLSTTS